MNQFEVPAAIEFALPELKEQLHKGHENPTIFQSLQCLTDHIRNKVLAHDLAAVKRSFNLAELIYESGNHIVKDALENILVFSFTSILSVCDHREVNVLHALIPRSLYSIYLRQMHGTGT